MTQPKPDLDDQAACLSEANTKLQDMLQEKSCELSLGQVADLASQHGVKPMELLTRVAESDTCFVDFQTGHVRCVPTVSEILAEPRVIHPETRIHPVLREE